MKRLRSVPTLDLFRQCSIVEETLTEREVELWRHHHCASYDNCLEDVCKALPKGGKSWVCNAACPGRQTYKPYSKIVLSEELTQRNVR